MGEAGMTGAHYFVALLQAPALVEQALRSALLCARAEAVSSQEVMPASPDLDPGSIAPLCPHHSIAMLPDMDCFLPVRCTLHKTIDCPNSSEPQYPLIWEESQNH